MPGLFVVLQILAAWLGLGIFAAAIFHLAKRHVQTRSGDPS